MVLEVMRPNPMDPIGAVPTFVRTLASLRNKLAKPEIWSVLDHHLTVATLPVSSGRTGPMAVSMALMGAGQRGTFAYGPFALKAPNELRFVAVAEPQPDRRSRFAALSTGSRRNVEFSSWEDLLDGPRLADAVLVATPDRLHHAPAVARARGGLRRAGRESRWPQSKATSTTLWQLRIAPVDCCRSAMSLRYTPFFQTLHEVRCFRPPGRHRLRLASGEFHLLAYGAQLRAGELEPG